MTPGDTILIDLGRNAARAARHYKAALTSGDRIPVRFILPDGSSCHLALEAGSLTERQITARVEALINAIDHHWQVPA